MYPTFMYHVYSMSKWDIWYYLSYKWEYIHDVYWYITCATCPNEMCMICLWYLASGGEALRPAPQPPSSFFKPSQAKPSHF